MCVYICVCPCVRVYVCVFVCVCKSGVSFLEFSPFTVCILMIDFVFSDLAIAALTHWAIMPVQRLFLSFIMIWSLKSNLWSQFPRQENSVRRGEFTYNQISPKGWKIVPCDDEDKINLAKWSTLLFLFLGDHFTFINKNYY